MQPPAQNLINIDFVLIQLVFQEDVATQGYVVTRPSRRSLSMDEIAAMVEKSGGILSFHGHVLRDAIGAKRLGQGSKLNEVLAELDRLRLEADPKSGILGSTLVRLYRPDMPVGRLIHAAKQRGVALDQVLRDAARSLG